MTFKGRRVPPFIYIVTLYYIKVFKQSCPLCNLPKVVRSQNSLFTSLSN